MTIHMSGCIVELLFAKRGPGTKPGPQGPLLIPVLRAIPVNARSIAVDLLASRGVIGKVMVGVLGASMGFVGFRLDALHVLLVPGTIVLGPFLQCLVNLLVLLGHSL